MQGSSASSLSGFLKFGVTQDGFCSAPTSIIKPESNSQPLYWKVTNPTLSPSHLQDLPGFTRSVYKRDHALITPESHVFSPLPDWTNTLGAYLISPAAGAHFVMYLAKMQENSRSGLPPRDVESHKLIVDSYAYLPSNLEHSVKCDASATLVVFERRHAYLENYIPDQIVSSTDKQPVLETPGEKQPALWWESYGEECKELQKLAIRVLSLTCSATGCERNWSTFDHVHSKKRNRLEQQRLNALVFVKYNIQLELRQIKRQERGEIYDPIYLSDMESDDEWITEKEDPCLPEDHSWMDIQECFEDDEGTTSKKRKRGPRNLNAIDRGKRKVFEDDDEVELIEGGEEEEEEEEEFDEVTMVDDDEDDEDDIDLGDDED
ncbi:unnamed protein product [Camellia sinensis]